MNAFRNHVLPIGTICFLSLMLATTSAAQAQGLGVGAEGLSTIDVQILPESGRTPLPSNIMDPALEAQGMPFGAFRLYPALVLAVATDDNVFRRETPTQSDTLFTIAPRLSLESQSEGHYFALRGGLTAYEYSDYSSESVSNWYALVEGGVEAAQGTRLFGSASYTDTHEPRGYFDQATTVSEPTPFSVFHADARIERQPNRFGVAAGINYDSYDYNSSKLTGGGVSSNDDRNFDLVEAYGRLSYEFSPGYSVYVHTAYNWRTFDLAVDRNGVDRDSTGYRVNGGLRMEVTRLITGEAYVGYLAQDYMAPLGNVDGFNFGGNIIWSPTPLVDVHIGAARSIVETVVSQDFVPASASDQRSVNFGIDYAFRRNIVLRGGLGYLENEFTGTTRTDDIFSTAVSGSYIFNRYMSLTAGYSYENRDSSIAGEDYTANVFRLALGLQV